MNFLKALFICLLFICNQKSITAFAKESKKRNTKLTKTYSSNHRTQEMFSSVQLVSSLQSLSTHTKKIPIGIWIELDKNWHTYWKFPGTTGKALNIYWNKNRHLKMSAAPLRWPIPERLLLGSSISFVYKNKVLTITELSLDSPPLKTLSPLKISAQVEWFICETLCIPMKQDVQLSLPITDVSQNDPYWVKIFEDWSQKIPSLVQNQGTIQSQDENYWLIQFPTNNTYQVIDFFPLSSDIFSLQKPEILSHTNNKHSLQVKKSATISNDNNIRQALVILKDKQGKQTSQWLTFSQQTKQISSLFWFCLLAFLGGLLLNFMPCVLPIVFLKLSNSIEQSQKSSAGFIKSNMAYSFGVIFSFITLALLVVALKQAGHAVNWGFQMQNPFFLIGMTFLFLLISFNFLGWFSFPIPKVPFLYKGQNHLKHFLTGVLSTTAASPCTVPFMGAAVAYAFAGSTFTVLIVFIFLGFGLSFPYILLSFFPKGIKYLPTPGIWNEKLKHCMVFPMLGTCAWLIHLISQHTNELFPLLFSMVSMALAFWFIHHISQKKLWIHWVLRLFILVSLIYPFAQFSSQKNEKNTYIQWEDFSTTKMKNLKSQGEAIFLQFSAQWCLTCQWNEKTTLRNKKVVKFFNQHNIHALKGDWTHKNREISSFLDRYNRSGIPFYLYIPGKISHKEKIKEIILPELITPDLLLRKLSQNRK